MHKMRTIVPVLACFWLAGCLEFPEPLGPVSESFIDSHLVGAWSCVSSDEPTPAVLTFMDFDGKQYYLQFTESEGKDTGHLRAHATRVGEASFLNVTETGGEQEKSDWYLLKYSFVETGLQLRIVNRDPFRDIRESGAQVRELLEQHLDDPEFYDDLLGCTKVPSSDAVETPG